MMRRSTLSKKANDGMLGEVKSRKRTKTWEWVMPSAWFLGSVFVFAGLLFAPFFATAATWKGYAGSVNKSTVDVSMVVGESRTIILTYTNTGEKTWKQGIGHEKVNLFLVGAHTSPLQDSSWVDRETIGKIHDSSVAPGASTTILFRIHASKAGTYTETIRLAATNVAWMREAETKLTIRVTGTGSASIPQPSGSTIPPPSTPPPSTSTNAPSVSNAVSGMLLLRSTKEVVAPGGDAVKLTYGFKNTGGVAWNKRSLHLASVQSAMVNAKTSWLYDSTWESPTVAVMETSEVRPGEIGFLSFYLTAPPKRGSYTARFTLSANDTPIDGAYVDIPVTVTSDGAYVADPPIVPPTIPVTPPSSNGTIPVAPNAVGTEPIVRIGLFRTSDDQMKIKGWNGGYRVYQGNNTVCTFTKDQEVTIRFDRTNLVYVVSGPGCASQSKDSYQVRSLVGDWEPLVMSDFNRPVSWLPGANDNTFRGILELRYASDDPDRDVWTVNELPIELYLRGIAETSDVSPLEYQKALLTAARTYAYYHWTRGTKHGTRGFHIDAKYDQVYRGYGAEARSPKIVRAVTETRGQIVTYNKTLAITPYFSRSDGRTRNWDEVWYGGSKYPWLKSVSVPHDKGRTLWGHGVGMSATGALGMANDGDDYAKILKHFYTGIELMTYY